MPPPPAPPPELARLAPGWTAVLAYQLAPGLSTWRLTGPAGVGALRQGRHGTGRYPTLHGESERMIWAAAYLPVPEVVALEQLGPTTILLTEGLPGRDATDRPGATTCRVWCGPSAAGCGTSTKRSARSGAPSASTSSAPLEHVARRVDTDDYEPGGFHDGARRS